MKNIVLFSLLISACISNANAIQKPVMYLPFDGSVGTNGLTDPGWADFIQNPPEQPLAIGCPTAIVAPVITTPTNGSGLKGGYADFLSITSVTTDKIKNLHYTGTAIGGLSGAKSFTVTWWCKSKDSTKIGPIANGYPVYWFASDYSFGIRWRTDGKVLPSYRGVWLGTGPVAASWGQWIFIACTFDTVNGVYKMYSGKKDQSVSLLETVSTLSTTAVGPVEQITIGGMWGKNNASTPTTYMAYVLDEVKIFASKVDSAGALSLEELEQLRLAGFNPVCGDYEHPYVMVDLNDDCITDFADFSEMAKNWMLDVRPQ